MPRKNSGELSFTRRHSADEVRLSRKKTIMDGAAKVCSERHSLMKSERRSEPLSSQEVYLPALNATTGSTMRLLISVAIIAATFAVSGCFHHHQAATTEVLPTPPLKLAGE
jgi:hypothetical protein